MPHRICWFTHQRNAPASALLWFVVSRKDLRGRIEHLGVARRTVNSICAEGLLGLYTDKVSPTYFSFIPSGSYHSALHIQRLRWPIKPESTFLILYCPYPWAWWYICFGVRGRSSSSRTCCSYDATHIWSRPRRWWRVYCSRFTYHWDCYYECKNGLCGDGYRSREESCWQTQVIYGNNGRDFRGQCIWTTVHNDRETNICVLVTPLR